MASPLFPFFMNPGCPLFFPSADPPGRVFSPALFCPPFPFWAKIINPGAPSPKPIPKSPRFSPPGRRFSPPFFGSAQPRVSRGPGPFFPPSFPGPPGFSGAPHHRGRPPQSKKGGGGARGPPGGYRPRLRPGRRGGPTCPWPGAPPAHRDRGGCRAPTPEPPYSKIFGHGVGESGGKQTPGKFGVARVFNLSPPKFGENFIGFGPFFPFWGGLSRDFFKRV